MNPVPHNLRHLEALFDQLNVDSRGQLLGESSSFYLSSKPVLPVLPPDLSSPKPDQALQLPRSGATTVVSSPLLSQPASATPSASQTSSPGPCFSPASPPQSLNHVSACREPEYPIVAHSIAVMSQFPPPRLARELIVIYLDKINRFVPLIPTTLLDEYDAGIPQSPFLLLAIFAIASKYSPDPLCRSDPLRAQSAGENYCKTACRLIDEFLDCPRLSTIQGLFLLGKHLEESKNPNVYTKSYVYVGMAFRMAISMGLNRNCSGWGLDPTQVEYRNRTWWYLYVYDRRQGSSYGRPFQIQDQDCMADKPKPDPLARDPDQDKEVVEHFLNVIHLSILLGRVVNTFYPVNTSGSNFHCSSKNVYGHAGGRAQVVDMLTSTGSSSTSTGSRKRTKTASRPKAKPLDQLSGPEGINASDANASGNAAAQASLHAHREMVIRQYIANQRQDAVVAELDKELTEWVQALPPQYQWSNLEKTPNAFGGKFDQRHSEYCCDCRATRSTAFFPKNVDTQNECSLNTRYPTWTLLRRVDPTPPS